MLRSFRTRTLTLFAVALAAFLSACNQDSAPSSLESVYIRGANVEFRDQLGPDTQVVGHFESGERVEILARRPRWAQVRRSTGEVGWVQQTALVPQEIFDHFALLAESVSAMPSQGQAIVRRTANLHLTPGRDTVVFYQLRPDEYVDVMDHDIAERPGSDPSQMEDWLLVRNGSRVGWLLEGAVDLDPPFEVARYREGQRIRAWFVLHTEMDDGEPRNWYLWATVPRLTGEPHDFQDIRVFVWNPRADRYETSYRERNMVAYFPIEIGTRQTPQGPSPTFRFHVQGPDGERVLKSYYMLGRLVRSGSPQP